MVNKVFTERLNRELDNLGLPELMIDRIDALAKLIKIPKFKAQSLLDGVVSSEDPVLSILAEELEVSPDWLLGKQDQK